jgi:hypothetical protein
MEIMTKFTEVADNPDFHDPVNSAALEKLVAERTAKIAELFDAGKTDTLASVTTPAGTYTRPWVDQQAAEDFAAYLNTLYPKYGFLPPKSITIHDLPK